LSWPCLIDVLLGLWVSLLISLVMLVRIAICPWWCPSWVVSIPDVPLGLWVSLMSLLGCEYPSWSPWPWVWWGPRWPSWVVSVLHNLPWLGCCPWCPSWVVSIPRDLPGLGCDGVPDDPLGLWVSLMISLGWDAVPDICLISLEVWQLTVFPINLLEVKSFY
jgi:hypothetical protein